MNERPVDQPYAVLDLFAGYGGFSLAFDAVDGLFRTIGFSEIDPYVSAVLAERFPGIPNLGAVQHVSRDSVLAACGVLPVVVTGGFPCQPHSVAGSRGAGDDERDLWGECLRVLRDLRPPFAIFENVPGLFTSDGTSPDGVDQSGLFFNRILSDLAEVRYAALWSVVSASDVGAPHKRDRVWILCVDELAYAARVGLREGQRGDAIRFTGGASDGRAVADGEGAGRGECRPSTESRRIGHVDGGGSGLADAASERAQGRRTDGEQEPSAHARPGLSMRGRSAGRVWPAAEGRWPAPPGPDQHEWEPPRVVGGEVKPVVGGDAYGSADRVDATVAEVCSAAQAGGLSDSVNRAHRLKATGNGIVPACAYVFAAAIADVILARGLRQ